MAENNEYYKIPKKSLYMGIFIYILIVAIIHSAVVLIVQEMIALKIIELLIIIVIGFFIAFLILKRPFDIQKNIWAREIKLPGKLAYYNKEEYEDVCKRIESRDYSPILERPREVRYNQAVFGYVKIYKVGKENTGYISLWNQSVKKEKALYTERDVKHEQVVKTIMIGKDNVDNIEERLKKARPDKIVKN